LCRTVACRDADAGTGTQFLVRSPGLGIRGHGPLLAMVPVHRFAAVAVPRWTRAVAGAARQVGNSLHCWPAVSIYRCDRPVLRRGTGLERTHASVAGGVLALVAGAFVGGRFLRSLCHLSRCL